MILTPTMTIPHTPKSGTMTILIEGAGTATCISLIKGLRKQQEFPVRIISTDMGELVAGRHFSDAYEVVPGSKDPGYIDHMLELCKREQVDVYIPIIDYGFRVLSQARERFASEGVYLMIMSPEKIETVLDKYKTFEFFASLGLNTPHTWEAQSTEEATALPYPVLLKPRVDGRASLGVYIVENVEEFAFHTRENDNYVIQHIVGGREFTVDVLSNLDGSRYIASCVRERVETKGGVSVKATIIEEPYRAQIESDVQTIVEALEVPGICNVQGFISEDGTISYTELNPRSAGTHAFSIFAGLNSAHRLLQLMSGVSEEDIANSIEINPEAQMVRYWNEVFTSGEQTSTWDSLIQQ